MPFAIPRAYNNWLKRLLKSQNVFELLTLKEGDVICLTSPSLILVNMHGILSTVKKYTQHKSFIFALSTSNTLLYYRTNKSICYHKVQALTNSYVLVVPNIDNLTDKFIRNEIRLMEFESLVLNISYLDSLILAFSQNSIVKRVLVFLLVLAKQIGLFFEDSIVISLGLSHTYLAEALGTTRVSITRSLNKLSREFILIERKKITILNPIALVNCVLIG
nr:ntcA [Erythrotrichia longistipitata]